MPDQSLATQTNAAEPQNWYWEDSCWINPPFHEYRIAELDFSTFAPEGSLKAATRQAHQLRQEGLNALVIRTAQQPYNPLTANIPVQDEARQLRHFVDVCHFEGIAVCLDVNYSPAEGAGPGNPNTRFLVKPHWQNCLDNALKWFQDFHIDALRLSNIGTLSNSGTFIRQLRRATDQLTNKTGRQYYLLVDCENSPVAIQGHYTDRFLCQAAQSESDSTDLLVAEGHPDDSIRTYRRDFVYNRQFARALDDLYGRVA